MTLGTLEIVRPGRHHLHVSQGGSGDDACVFIHGLGEEGDVWEDFATDIARSHEVYLLDLRGHGLSSKADADAYRLSDYVGDTVSIMAELPLKRYVLVGHSLGGAIAMELMNVGDPRVAGVVLVDAGPSSDREVAAYLRDQLIEGHTIFGSVSDYARWVAERRPLLAPRVAQQLAERSLIPMPAGFQPRYDVEVARSWVQEDESIEWWMERLRNCAAAALLVRGSGSAVLTRSVAELMVSTLKQGTLVTVSHAGHGVMSDNPAGFADAVKPFVTRCLARAASSSLG